MLSRQEYLGHTVNFKTYRKVKGGCSSHQIRNVVVEDMLLDRIRQITSFAHEHEEGIIRLKTSQSRAALDKSLRDGKRELEQSQARIAKPDEIIQRLYEDNISGKISDGRFPKMTASYEAEQKVHGYTGAHGCDDSGVR